MARKGDIKFIPTASPTGAALMPLDMIPVEIRAEIEQIYAALASAGSGRMRVEFDTPAEVKEYATQVKTYCALRPTDVEAVKAQFTEYVARPDATEDDLKLIPGITTGGPLRFRQSPTKGLEKTVMDFRVVDVPEESEKATEDIRNAVEAVKDAAATPPEAAPNAAPTPGPVKAAARRAK